MSTTGNTGVQKLGNISNTAKVAPQKFLGATQHKVLLLTAFCHWKPDDFIRSS
jgi:hypothetical protein